MPAPSNSTRKYEFEAVDSNGSHCKLLMIEYYRTFQGDNPADRVTALTHASCIGPGNEELYVTEGKFRSPLSGNEFTTTDPRAVKLLSRQQPPDTAAPG
jgi:hypothetical protein